MVVVPGTVGPDPHGSDQRIWRSGLESSEISAVAAAAGDATGMGAGAVHRRDSLNVIVDAIPIGKFDGSLDRHFGRRRSVDGVERGEDIGDLRIHGVSGRRVREVILPPAKWDGPGHYRTPALQGAPSLQAAVTATHRGVRPWLFPARVHTGIRYANPRNRVQSRDRSPGRRRVAPY